MSVQKGTKGVVWSIVTSVSPVVGTVTATCKIQKVSFKRGGENKEFRDTDGVIFNSTFFAGVEECTIEAIPTGATKALAATSNILPARGDDITVTDTQDSNVAGSGTAAGTSMWMFVDGSKEQAVDDAVKITLNLKRYESYLPTVS